MGYETKLIIIEKKKEEAKGYCSIIGTLELSKCCYNKMEELINKSTIKNEKLEKEITDLDRKYSVIFGPDGNYTEELLSLPEEKKEAIIKEYYASHRKLEKKLPYIYLDGNTESWTDSYGSLLIVATVEETLEALIRDQAKSIETGKYSETFGYRRFDAAIQMLKAFTNKQAWPNVSVILYGH